MKKLHVNFDVALPDLSRSWSFVKKYLLPNPGTIILLLLLAMAVPALASQQSAPSAASITTIPYQGRLADAAGQPITSRQNMEFRLYDTPNSATPLWQEFWTGGNAVNVSDGLFSVMLGSINTGLSAVVQSHSELYLGITVGTDTEMSPRVQLGSVPFSLWSLTVADNSITTAKIAAGVITTTHLANSAVTSAKIGNDAVGSAQVINGAITANKLSPTAAGKWTMLDLPIRLFNRTGGGFDWQIFDLSTVAPATARSAYIKVFINAPQTNIVCGVRPYGSTAAIGLDTLTLVPNIYNVNVLMIGLHSSKFEYKCNAPVGATMTDMGIELWGYFEPGY